MTFKEIKDLIKIVDDSDLTEIKIKNGEFEISIRTKQYSKGAQMIPVQAAPVQAMAPVSNAPATAASTQPEAPAAEDNSNAGLLEIKSPIVGTFYRSPSPDKDAYVKVGDSVSAGSVVCIVEAMKLFNEIESEVSGKIVKVMVDEASPVQYDQVLFLVDPNG